MVLLVVEWNLIPLVFISKEGLRSSAHMAEIENSQDPAHPTWRGMCGRKGRGAVKGDGE